MEDVIENVKRKDDKIISANFFIFLCNFRIPDE